MSDLYIISAWDYFYSVLDNYIKECIPMSEEEEHLH